jgi:restriction system protein
VGWFSRSSRATKICWSITGPKSKKRNFITTGSFSRDALEFSSRIDSKIVLIDGKKLVDLMIDHNIGVSIVKTYEMKKLDLDYFEEAV